MYRARDFILESNDPEEQSLTSSVGHPVHLVNKQLNWMQKQAELF